MQPLLDSQISILLSLLDDGVISETDVVQWADQQIESAPDAKSLPAWLLELSLHGPEECRRRREFDLPWPADLSFAERLAARAERVDINSYESLLTLARWASRACMGDDIEDEAVAFGYQLDHLLDDCDKPNLAVELVREWLAGHPPLTETPGP